MKEKNLLAPDFLLGEKNYQSQSTKAKYVLVFFIKLKFLFEAFDEINFAYLFKHPQKPSSSFFKDCHLKNVESGLAFDFLKFEKFWWT